MKMVSTERGDRGEEIGVVRFHDDWWGFKRDNEGKRVVLGGWDWD